MSLREMRALYVCLLAVLLLPGCLEDDLAVTDKISGGVVHYLGADYNTSALPNDAYRIVGITPGADTWRMVVEYSGGCQEHDFFIWWDGQWSENPVETSLYIFYDDNDDSCEAIVRDTLFLDLNRVFYGEVPEDLYEIMIVNANTGKQISIPIDLLELAQTVSCSLEAEIVSTACQESIWLDRWLLLADSVGSFQTVWLQPVRNSETVSLELPEKGSYEVGVTALFGFEYSGDGTVTCQSYPEGEVIPVVVNCLTRLKD